MLELLILFQIFLGVDSESDDEVTHTTSPPWHPRQPPVYPPVLQDEFVVPAGARAEMICKMRSKTLQQFSSLLVNIFLFLF